MNQDSKDTLDGDLHTQVLSIREWSPQQRAVFIRRAKGHAKLNHPHILKLVDIQVQRDEVRLVSEAAGSHLGQRWEALDRDRFIKELLGTLDFAHKNGIVHGCLCPKNLRFGHDGSIEAPLQSSGTPRNRRQSGNSVRASLAGTESRPSPGKLGELSCWARPRRSHSLSSSHVGRVEHRNL